MRVTLCQRARRRSPSRPIVAVPIGPDGTRPTGRSVGQPWAGGFSTGTSSASRTSTTSPSAYASSLMRPLARRSDSAARTWATDAAGATRVMVRTSARMPTLASDLTLRTRALAEPRPDLGRGVGEERCEQAQQRLEGEAQRGTGARSGLVALTAVGAVLDELEVVVAERPEEGLRGLERAGVVPALEPLGRLVDDVGEGREHRQVEGVGHGGTKVAVDVTEAEGELARVEHLDGEPAPDLHLAGVVGGVGAEATGGRPVAHRVGAVGLDDVFGRLGVALGLAHLLAVGVEDPAADRGVLPRRHAVLEVRARHRGEEPGADDVVPLGTQVVGEDAREERLVRPEPVAVGGALADGPAGGDLRRQRRRGPRVHDVGVGDEATGLAALGLLVAFGHVDLGVDGKRGGGRGQRVVVVDLTRGVDGVPDRERHAEEALARDEPVAVEALDPVLVARAHEGGVEVDDVAHADELGAQRLLAAAVADVPLARGDDLERLVALLVEVGLALGLLRLSVEVAGLAERGHDGLARAEGRLRRERLGVERLAGPAGEPFRCLGLEPPVARDEGADRQLQLAPPHDVGEVAEG